MVFPKLLYSQKKQPFDFNHALHNELVDEGCESCHFFREDGSFAGAPKLEQCVGCHEEVQGETEEEEIFVNEYVANEREKVLDNVVRVGWRDSKGRLNKGLKNTLLKVVKLFNNNKAA